MAKNLTEGSPLRLITMFMLPIMIGNLFQQAYFVADTIVVGRLIGMEALAAVGVSGSLQFLLLGFAIGTCSGLAIPVAREFGAGNMPEMRRRVVAGLIVSLVVSVIVTLVGTLGAPALLRLLRTPHELMDEGSIFLTVFFAGTAAMVGFNYLSAVIRALGDSRTPLYFLVFSSVLNVILVVWFIGGLGMGIGGAAFATIVAQVVSVVACVVFIWKKMPALHLTREDWKVSAGAAKESAVLGLSLGFQTSVIGLSMSLLQIGTNGLGTEFVAAFTAAIRIDNFSTIPLMSLGIGMTTYVAQNNGARQWARVRGGVKQATLLGIAMSIAILVLIVLFGRQASALFLGPDRHNVIELSQQFLVINAALYWILSILFVIRYSIQGLGSTIAPTMAGFLELVARGVAGLWVVPAVGFIGVILATPAAWIGALIPLLISWFYHRRRLVAAELAEATV